VAVAPGGRPAGTALWVAPRNRRTPSFAGRADRRRARAHLYRSAGWLPLYTVLLSRFRSRSSGPSDEAAGQGECTSSRNPHGTRRCRAAHVTPPLRPREMRLAARRSEGFTLLTDGVRVGPLTVIRSSSEGWRVRRALTGTASGCSPVGGWRWPGQQASPDPAVAVPGPAHRQCR
jgi:hypothetical protein